MSHLFLSADQQTRWHTDGLHHVEQTDQGHGQGLLRTDPRGRIEADVVDRLQWTPVEALPGDSDRVRLSLIDDFLGLPVTPAP